MKFYDYGVNTDLAYITNYKIKGDSIIVHYADGEKDKIPYSFKTEVELLNKMKEQVNSINLNGFDAYIKDKIKYDKSRVLLVSLICLGTFVGFMIPEGFVLELFISYLVAQGIITIGSIAHTSKLKGILNDFKKNKSFVDNEDILRDAMLDSKLNDILENTSTKTKKVIKENDCRININTIDDISCKDVINMLGNSYREKEFKRERVK